MKIFGQLSISQYIAVAFSFDKAMQDADLYYCTGTELKTGSIRELYYTPVADTTLPVS